MPRSSWRRRFAAGLTFAIFGPPIAAATLYALDWKLGGPSLLSPDMLLRDWPTALSMTYLLGLLPFLLIATILQLLEAQLRTLAVRFVAAIVVGDVVGAACVTLLSILGQFQLDGSGLITAATASGLAALVCAALSEFILHRRPAVGS